MMNDHVLTRTVLAATLLALLPIVASAQAPTFVIDGREVIKDVSVVILEEASLLPALEEARAYWRARDPEYEEDVRILDTAVGAFTRPGVTETAVLYLMSPWPRCCPKSGIAVLREGEVRANIAFEGIAQSLLLLPDIDHDGLNDLAMIGTFGQGGSNTTSATLFALRDDHVDVWTDVVIADDACAAGYEGRHAGIIEVYDGPTFTGRNVYSPGCDRDDWEDADGDVYFGDDRPSAEEFVFLGSRKD